MDGTTHDYVITATGVQPSVASTAAPFATYAISVKSTGTAATAWTVALEGSLDNVNWTTIATHNTASGDGAIVWETTGKAALFVRANVSALTLSPATALTIVVVAVP